MTLQLDGQTPKNSSPPLPRSAARIPRPAPGMRPARARRRAGPRTVLALFEQDCPTAGLRRAVALARALDAPIHVLRVLPEPKHLSWDFLRGKTATVSRMVQLTRSASQATRSWLLDTLASDDVIEQVAVLHGDFVTQTAAYAANVGADLLIVAPGEGKLGKAVKSLACATLMPVFVARGSAAAAAIMAATDLESADYPVLSRAADLGCLFRKPLVAVHNVEPQPLAAAEMLWPFEVWQPEHALAVRSGQLTRAAQRLRVETRTIVLHELRSADAILEQAKASDAELVVMGARRRPRLDGWSRGVTRRVVDRAACSVLVLPLDARPAAPVAPDLPVIS